VTSLLRISSFKSQVGVAISSAETMPVIIHPEGMDEIPIFLSFSKPIFPAQREFVRELSEGLASFGMKPRTLGVTVYDTGVPLTAIRNLISRSAGLISIAFRRSYVVKGWKYDCQGTQTVVDPVESAWLTSPWPHIEVGMAFQIDLPILVLREAGVTPDGILEKGSSALYLPTFNLEKNAESYLHSDEWQHIFHKWSVLVRTYVNSRATPLPTEDIPSPWPQQSRLSSNVIHAPEVDHIPPSRSILSGMSKYSSFGPLPGLQSLNGYHSEQISPPPPHASPRPIVLSASIGTPIPSEQSKPPPIMSRNSSFTQLPSSVAPQVRAVLPSLKNALPDPEIGPRLHESMMDSSMPIQLDNPRNPRLPKTHEILTDQPERSVAQRSDASPYEPRKSTYSRICCDCLKTGSLLEFSRSSICRRCGHAFCLSCRVKEYPGDAR
jgi:hypothetical protein